MRVVGFGTLAHAFLIQNVMVGIDAFGACADIGALRTSSRRLGASTPVRRD